MPSATPAESTTVDPRRYFGVLAAENQTVALEIAQRLGEHLLGDALDAVANLRVAARAAK